MWQPRCDPIAYSLHGKVVGVHDRPAWPLATVRRRQLLSQRALARQAGVALSTVYLIESGQTEHATFKVMRAVSDALAVDPASIAEFRRVIDGGANRHPPYSAAAQP